MSRLTALFTLFVVLAGCGSNTPVQTPPVQDQVVKDEAIVGQIRVIKNETDLPRFVIIDDKWRFDLEPQSECETPLADGQHKISLGWYLDGKEDIYAERLQNFESSDDYVVHWK